MIVIDEMPYKFVDNEGFRRFIPSSTTITRDRLKLYMAEKSRLIKYFAKIGQRLSWTTNL